mgnify:CR=1 FL=1
MFRWRSGVLTTHTRAEEALERAGEGPSSKGWEARPPRIEMAALVRRLSGQPGRGAEGKTAHGAVLARRPLRSVSLGESADR